MRLVLVGVVVALLSGHAVPVQARIAEGGPNSYADVTSIGDRIAASSVEQPVHIIFVHGIRAEGRGTAATLVSHLCKALRSACLGVDLPDNGPPTRLEVGAYPRDATLMGRRIWLNEGEWTASQPFLDRYVLRLDRGRVGIVDEVNWWPLLFPIKCRFLVAEDAKLAGLDRKQDEICRGPRAPQIDPTHIDWMRDYTPAPGPPAQHQAGVNVWLKQQILNWGLSDAVVALGPMQNYLHRAMELTFEAAAKYDGRSPEAQDFIIVSESLGSFVVMDSFHSAAPETSLRRVVGGSSDLYFFANQFALLEIGRIRNVAVAPGDTFKDLAPGPGSADALLDWATSAPTKSQADGSPRLKQIVSVSDPSDILSFMVPAIEKVTVVNLYDRNGLHLLGIADPLAAHSGHARNQELLKYLLTPNKPAAHRAPRDEPGAR